MLGTRLRQARQARRLSLNDVATRAKISVATLSRLERDKQGIELGMFLTLSRILKTPPHELISDDGDSDRVEPLAARIARLNVGERTELWRELAANRRSSVSGRRQIRHLSYEVEELLAQVDFLREEIDAVRSRLRRR
jgi:transcriptional regulator with XRE-family HTH domain